jgi:hypothetical protein
LNTKVGTITHYFDNIGVAVVKLTKPVKVGDHITIKGGDNEFTQTISSMQFDHKPLKTAKSKSEIGLKVDQPVKDKYIVYKTT